MGKKKLYIQTFGCQMNVQDAQKMAVLLEESGYGTTDDPEQADLILVNTCSIREKAAQKIYSQLGRFRELKERNPRLLIGVGGCLAQQWGDRFFRRVPYLDLVVGTHQIDRLPEMVGELERAGGRIVETGFCDRVGSLDIPAQPAAGAVSTFVTIMQGCNNFCAYCVVPHLRGREQSRPLPEILREIETLAARGIREVTLLGQNVNSYGQTLPGETDFTELISAIGKVPGIGRIRFTTSHPKDLSPRLIACFGEIASLCEHIHLPVQSGSDRVLRRMNRGYTAEAYREKVAELRRVCPEISITSDVIVGFPGEEEEDFQPAAAGMDRPVREGVKRERLWALQALQAAHTLEKNRACIGRWESVLVEGPNRNGCEEMTGRTRGNRIVHFPGRAGLIGKTVSVRIVDAFPHSLRGEVEERGGANVH
ncbi:MAG: tRNA (N6-isopentenyl adenosine(37)-C2)-methylthiotransferase MiaB [Deltaproteobacteria bacterium]|nr:tRNA (N6-isopentenyl adenosine(37)-C2)-methylthiotransferase MiaB [Deltaproteobacteria bacterium]